MSDIVYRKWAYEDILAIAELEKKCFSDPWSSSAYLPTGSISCTPNATAIF